MFWTVICLQKNCHSTCSCKFQHLAPRMAGLDLHLQVFLKDEVCLFWLKSGFLLFCLKILRLCLAPSFSSACVPVGVWTQAWGGQGTEEAHLCEHIPVLPVTVTLSHLSAHTQAHVQCPRVSLRLFLDMPRPLHGIWQHRASIMYA